MMDINYELYKVFYHVATTLNFSEASKQLFISQSAVSQSIKTLERKLDQTLFIRSTKKVQLTPEGEILLRHIEPAMNLIQKGEAQLLDAASTGGQIRIGASDTICRYFLVPYLEKFHKMFPNVHIKVINQTSLHCTELLKNGLVDLIVVNYPNASLNNISASMKIKNFRDVFIAGNNYGDLKEKKISLSDLLAYPILMLDKNSTTNEFLHRLFQQHQLDLVPEIELTSNDLLIDLARIGLGIAFIPDYCISKESDGIFTLDMNEEMPERSLVVAYNEQLPLFQGNAGISELLPSGGRVIHWKKNPVEESVSSPPASGLPGFPDTFSGSGGIFFPKLCQQLCHIFHRTSSTVRPFSRKHSPIMRALESFIHREGSPLYLFPYGSHAPLTEVLCSFRDRDRHSQIPHAFFSKYCFRISLSLQTCGKSCSHDRWLRSAGPASGRSLPKKYRPSRRMPTSVPSRSFSNFFRNSSRSSLIHILRLKQHFHLFFSKLQECFIHSFHQPVRREKGHIISLSVYPMSFQIYCAILLYICLLRTVVYFVLTSLPISSTLRFSAGKRRFCIDCIIVLIRQITAFYNIGSASSVAEKKIVLFPCSR